MTACLVTARLTPRWRVARPAGVGSPWLHALRTRAALGLAPVVAPAVLFVPIGAALGPSFANVLTPVALGYLDAVVTVALAVLGIFVGLALDLREARDGRLSESRFGARMQGTGARWRMIDDLFESAWRREGFERMPKPPPSAFERPEKKRAQLALELF